MAITLKHVNASPDLAQTDPIDLGMVPTPGDLWIVGGTASSLPGFTKIAGPLVAGTGSTAYMHTRTCETGDTGQIFLLGASHWLTALFSGASETPAAQEEIDDGTTPGPGGTWPIEVDIAVPSGPHLVIGYFNHDNTVEPTAQDGWTLLEAQAYAGAKYHALVYAIVDGGTTYSPGVTVFGGGYWFGVAAAFPAAGLPEPPGGLIIE